ncbi:MAG UNVERIFIED_CONTAM: hypothetical protein LVQ98_08360 [Rickettsiaceae bacterium]
MLAKKAGGKLLSNNKHNKKKFLEQYAQDKAKLKRESADLDKSYESVDIKLTKIELELKNNLNLALELKALNAKRLIGALKNAHNLDVEFNLPDEEKYNKVNEDLKVSTRNLESLYAQNSSILQRVKGLFRNDEELRLEMLKLMQEFKASKEKKEAYKQDMKARMAYAEDYEKELKNTEEEYNDAKSRMEEALSKFKKCKYKIDDESPLQNVLLCWNELEALHSSIEDKKQDVVMAAQVLLLDEINMVWSIKPQFKNMSTKEKTAHIAKEAFLFNTQFHEKYQISGSKGEEGGPAGYCIVNHDFLIIENHQGIGGKHASGLEGLREENYTLATLRGIRATHQDQGIGMAGAPVISVINGAAVQIAAAAIKPAATLLPKTTTLFAAGNGGIAATAVATAIPTWGLSLAVGGAMLLTQLLISPIVASTTSCWVDGPYQYDLGNAKNGVSNTSFVIINPQELNEEHSQYIISFLEQAGAVLCEENIFAALGIPINIDPFGCSFSNVDMHPPMQHMGQPAVMFDNADVV